MSLFWQCVIDVAFCWKLVQWDCNFLVWQNVLCYVVLAMKSRLDHKIRDAPNGYNITSVDVTPWQWRLLLKFDCPFNEKLLVMPTIAFVLYGECPWYYCFTVVEAPCVARRLSHEVESVANTDESMSVQWYEIKVMLSKLV